MTPLSQLLRESSRPEHTAAESRPFITLLMSGELDVAAYIAYAANLLPVYRALESRTTVGEPVSGSDALWDPSLHRVSALEHDLTALGAHDHGSSLVTDASRNYGIYLESLSGRNDHRLIAHHYTRYLGDLSGGQAIGALVERHYGITPDQLTFCAFTGIDNFVRYKETYRSRLDALALTETDRGNLVAEVKKAFALNQSIFDSLGAQLHNS